MSVKLETERLILRELILDDVHYMFELDSNEQVQQYCEKCPLTSPDQSREIIERIRKQYEENGIGRWIVFVKETNEFIGWAGLKMESDVNGHERFVDLGFRILPQYWNRGYMTEAAKALVQYGFNTMKYDKICAWILSDNPGSIRVVEKAGLKRISNFVYEDEENEWYEITREEYLSSI
eukprot:gene1049-1111_t